MVTAGDGQEVITATAAIGRIANLTLRQTGGAGVGLRLRHGRMEVEDCDISSEGLSGVTINGPACPTLRRNRIHGNGLYGCQIDENSGGEFTGNSLTDNGRGAWGIHKSSLPRVIRSGNIPNQ